MARSTLVKQASKARAKSLGALHMFKAAAKELEDAAKEHNHVALVAAGRAAELQGLSDTHVEQAEQAAKAATKLRDLVGGDA